MRGRGQSDNSTGEMAVFCRKFSLRLCACLLFGITAGTGLWAGVYRRCARYTEGAGELRTRIGGDTNAYRYHYHRGPRSLWIAMRIAHEIGGGRAEKHVPLLHSDL